MKNVIIVFVLTCLIVSCSTSKKLQDKTAVQNNTSVSNEIGSSFDKAIVITEKNETEGVAAEYAWLRENYPGYKTKKQQLVTHNKKPYDIIEIVTADGKKKSIYFDISDFFGKF